MRLPTVLRLTTLPLAAVLVLGACNDSGPSADPGPSGTTTTDPTATAAPGGLETATRPTALACDEEKRRYISLDWAGSRRFTDVLAYADRLGRPYVDRKQRRIWLLREDGSAHGVVTWTRAAAPERGREWFVDAVETCLQANRHREVSAPASRVELEIGHCWIEPVTVGGERWDVVAEDQHGWGAGALARLSGQGRLAPAGEVAIYVDDKGRRLTLVPEDDPWTVTRGGCD